MMTNQILIILCGWSGIISSIHLLSTRLLLLWFSLLSNSGVFSTVFAALLLIYVGIYSPLLLLPSVLLVFSCHS